MSNPEQNPNPQGPAEFPEVRDPELDPDIQPDDPAEPQRNPDEPQE